MIAFTLRTSTSRQATARAVQDCISVPLCQIAERSPAGGTYRGQRTFGGQTAPICASALRPHYCSCAQHTLVMRIIEWFDMAMSIADQASYADICVSCDGSYGDRGWRGTRRLRA